MGWKSTKYISREQAISAIRSVFNDLDGKNNEELAEIMVGLGIGDEITKI